MRRFAVDIATVKRRIRTKVRLVNYRLGSEEMCNMSLANRASDQDVENIFATVNMHEVCLSAAHLNIFLYHVKFEINNGMPVSKTWLVESLIRIIEHDDKMLDKIPDFREMFNAINPKSNEDVFTQEELDGLMSDLMIYSHQVYRNLSIPIKQFRSDLKEIIKSIEVRS